MEGSGARLEDLGVADVGNCTGVKTADKLRLPDQLTRGSLSFQISQRAEVFERAGSGFNSSVVHLWSGLNVQQYHELMSAASWRNSSNE